MWPYRSTTIINNNIGFMPPRIHHHHCGGFGNAFNWMAGFSLAQNMMSGIFSSFRMPTFMPTMPYYSFTGTPYTPAAYGQTSNAMSAARTTLDSLGFTKEAGYSVSMGEDGKLTYTYTNGSETITATNLKELLDKQAEARQTASAEDDDSWYQPASENGGDDPVEDVTDITAAEGDTLTEGQYNEHAQGRRQKVDRSPEGWYRSSRALDNKLHFDENELREHNGTGTAVDYVFSKMGEVITFRNCDENKLKQALIDKNPSVFDENGNLKENAEISKLDLPTVDWINKNCTKAITQGAQNGNTRLAKAEVSNNRVSMKYESGNTIYKEGDADDIMDKDVVFVIGGRKYKLLSKGKGEYVDYYQITNGRPNHYRDFKLVDPNTGRFNPNTDGGLWTDREYFNLISIDGTDAPLARAKISKNEQGQVILSKGGKFALMDDVMSKNAPLK